jgi:opacity protein-like surface antigen
MVGYASYFSTDDLAGDPTLQHTSTTLRGGVAYQIARGIRLRVGYGVTEWRLGGTVSKERGINADGGLDVSRALSISRRMTVAFATGLAGVRDENGRLRYLATGHANVDYEIGRSWTAAATFRRGVDFHQALRNPVVLDSASVGVGGLLGRRVSVNTGAAVSRGRLGIDTNASRYTAGMADVGVRIAMTRLLAVSAHYGYHRYKFNHTGTLPAGLRPELRRQSVRVSLDLWAPLVMVARRANATR